MPTFCCKTGVGFYFLLLLLLVYVRRAIINIPKRNMIVIASFSSIASPPFEGKLRPPKIKLYFHCNFNRSWVQAFCWVLFTILGVSDNVSVFTTSHHLKRTNVSGRDAIRWCGCVDAATWSVPDQRRDRGASAPMREHMLV